MAAGTRDGARVVAVVNPTKLDGVRHDRHWLERAAAALGVRDVGWCETTPQDTGRELAAAAVRAGATTVLAWGGDGTVRACAAGLHDAAGSGDGGTALGVLPAGTGNLLARNLDIPLDLDSALDVALTGRTRTIDLLEVGLGGTVEIGAVIAGMGLDADLMAAPEGLKDRVGPAAYAFGLVRGIRRDRIRVGVSVDGGPPRWTSARTVLVANVGGLVAGLDIAPEAAPDDGRLDVVVLALRSPTDWARAALSLVQRVPSSSSRWHVHGSEVLVVSRSDAPRQVDGDVVAEGSRLRVRVLPAALRIRVPVDGAV